MRTLWPLGREVILSKLKFVMNKNQSSNVPYCKTTIDLSVGLGDGNWETDRFTNFAIRNVHGYHIRETFGKLGASCAMLEYKGNFSNLRYW